MNNISSPDAAATAAENLRSQAEAAYQNGDASAAEAAFMRVVIDNPGDVTALNWLSRICLEQGRAAEALAYSERALVHGADMPDSLVSRGNALSKLGRVEEAAAALESALRARPDDPFSRFNLATCWAQLGKLEGAAAAFEAALALKPHWPGALNALAQVRYLMKDYAGAAEALQSLETLEPEFPDLAFNLGTCLQQAGRLTDALPYLQRAHGEAPGNAGIRYNLACCHLGLNQLEQAEEHFNEVLAALPGDLNALQKLAETRERSGELDKAMASLEKALNLAPNDPSVLAAAGALAKNINQMDRAYEWLGRAADLAPDNMAHQNNFALLLFRFGAFSEAIERLTDALKTAPSSRSVKGNLGTALNRCGRIDEALAIFEDLAAQDPMHADMIGNVVMSLHYKADIDAVDIRRRAEALMAPWQNGEARPRTLDLAPGLPGRRIRVGYVSADFKNHPVGKFAQAALAHHDHSAFEVFLYSNDVREDDFSRDMKASADHWRPIFGLDDGAFAELVSRDGIDILVDLAQHSMGNRLAAFAGRLAPIQASWIGYFGTTGVEAMDYLLADPVIAGEGAEAAYTETLMPVGEVALCHPPLEFDLEPAPVALAEAAHVTFGCFNGAQKLNNQTLSAWADILAAVPGARMLFKYHGYQDPAIQGRIRDLFQSAGVVPERMTFEGGAALETFLESYRRIDLAVDPFPYGGGMSTFEALWMGVPVLTCKSDRGPGRISESIIRSAGLDDLVSADIEDYKRKAEALAADPSRLIALKSGLRDRIEGSAFCDCKIFTKNMEDCFREMIARKQTGPQSQDDRTRER